MDIKKSNTILLPDEHFYYSARKSFYMEDHSHSFIEIDYVVQGSCIYYVNNQKVSLKSKNLLIMRSQTPHRLIFNSTEHNETFSLISIAFSGKQWQIGTVKLSEILLANSYVHKFFEDLGDYLVIRNGYPIFNTLEQLINECNSYKDPTYINLLINKLILEIARLSQNLYTNSFDHILEIKKVINENYHTIEELQDIASMVCLNKTYMQRIFKQQVGCTILQYITNIRMQRAASLLRNTDINIGDIDEHIGLKSRNNFYMLFKKTYNLSPLEYRKQYRSKK